MALFLTTENHRNGKGFETSRGTLKNITVKFNLLKLELPHSNIFVVDYFN